MSSAMGTLGGNRLFPFDGITLGYHSLTHHGKRPELLKELSIIERFYASQFATFLKSMKETQDSDGRPLLDSTVVLFGSGMGNASSHSSRNLPVLLSGGGFKHGMHHRFDRKGRDGRPLGDLFVSVLQQFGIETGSVFKRQWQPESFIDMRRFIFFGLMLINGLMLIGGQAIAQQRSADPLPSFSCPILCRLPRGQNTKSRSTIRPSGNGCGRARTS